MSHQLDSVRLRALQTRQERLSDEIELHCEQLDDDDKRLTRLEWAVIAIGACLVAMFGLIVWGLLR